MIVIVSVSKLDNGRIQVGVAKPQHDSKRAQSYASENEARKVLLGFGVGDEAADLYLFKLIPSQELTFPPMDVPSMSCCRAALRSSLNIHAPCRAPDSTSTNVAL